MKSKKAGNQKKSEFRKCSKSKSENLEKVGNQKKYEIQKK